MTNYKFLIFAFFPLCLFGDCADCEAYKTQVSTDCDSIISSCDSAIFDCQTAAGSAELFAGYYGSNSTERVALIQAAESASNAAGTLRTLKAFAQSIKSTVLSLQCTNTVGGSCDCAQYLQSLVSLLTTCNQTLAGVSSGLDSVNSALGSSGPEGADSIISLLQYSNEWLEEFALIFERFFKLGLNGIPINIADIYGAQTNLYNRLLYNSTLLNVGSLSKPIYWRMTTSGNTSVVRTSDSVFPQVYSITSFARQASLFDIVYGGFWQNFQYLSSLNNFANTNFLLSSSIKQDLSDIKNHFSIFNDFVFSSDAPLSMYTDIQTDGSYHDYLTNYYIKVSKGQQSGSDNFTNWFSRIEILLASLVFQDDGTNFVDSAENTSQMENALSQSVDTLSQAVSLPQNVTGKIDNMGQSFLGLLGEWRTIVSGNSLPSQFVLCDINLGSQSRDSSGGSFVSSFRLETSLDSGEFRQFLDFCHAITTILFTMLFVWLSTMLLSFLLASLAKLAHFCYLVYSALFGG